MSLLDALRYRSQALFKRAKFGRDAAAELEHHLELETIEQRRLHGSGARERAHRAVGNVTFILEERRAAAGMAPFYTLTQDLRYGLTVLGRRPAFAGATIVTMAVGIAAVATAFAIVDSVFLRPLPVPERPRLVRIFFQRPGGGARRRGLDAVRVLRSGAPALDEIVAHESRNVLQVGVGDRLIEQHGAFVSANYWRTLGIQPRIGRFFTAAEDSVLDRDPVAVVSSSFWDAELQRDPHVLGRRIRIGGREFVIIGVAPFGFDGIAVGEMPNDVWVPPSMARVGRLNCIGSPRCPVGDALGRLAPGASLQALRTQLRTVEPRLSAAAFPDDSVRHVTAEPAAGLSVAERADYVGLSRLLSAIASVILLIACANLSGLLVARGTARQREMAVRISLGASRIRLIRQLLTESLILAAIGGVVGAFASLWTTRGLMGFFVTDDEGFRHFFNLEVNARIVGLPLLVAGVSTLLFGIVAAFTSSRIEPADVLKTSRSGAGVQGVRIGSMLVSAQVALAILLLTAATLLMRSAASLMHAQQFNADRVAVLRWRPDLAGLEEARFEPALHQIVERLQALPEIESVAYRRCCNLVWSADPHGNAHVGLSATDTAAIADAQFVSPRFFSTLKVQTLAGREFTDGDREGTERVSIVNLPLARKLWGASIGPASIVGRALQIGSAETQVVGVVPDYQPRGAFTAAVPVVYEPYWQTVAGSDGDTRFAIRVRGDVTHDISLLMKTTGAVEPTVVTTEAMSMSSQIGARYVQLRLGEAVLAAAAGIALLLSAIAAQV
jgi:predicted permease